MGRTPYFLRFAEIHAQLLRRDDGHFPFLLGWDTAVVTGGIWDEPFLLRLLQRRMLYYSETNFSKRVAPDTLEDVDTKQPMSYNPEAFLPEEVRNAIYDDIRWFDRAKHCRRDLTKAPSCMCAKSLTRDCVS